MNRFTSLPSGGEVPLLLDPDSTHFMQTTAQDLVHLNQSLTFFLTRLKELQVDKTSHKEEKDAGLQQCMLTVNQIQEQFMGLYLKG